MMVMGVVLCCRVEGKGCGHLLSFLLMTPGLCVVVDGLAMVKLSFGS